METTRKNKKVNNKMDLVTGLPIISLGRPGEKICVGQLKEIDVIIFEIHNVGTRFYSYITPLYKLRESCVDYNRYITVLKIFNSTGLDYFTVSIN